MVRCSAAAQALVMELWQGLVSWVSGLFKMVTRLGRVWQDGLSSRGPQTGSNYFHAPSAIFLFSVFLSLVNCTALWLRSSKPACGPTCISRQHRAQ